MANDYIDQWNLNTVVYDIHDKGRGQPNGVATLDSEGRIPYSQLPEDALEFKGYWDASTNTPELEDGVGTSGDFYFVSVAGSQNLGSGVQYFAVGDRVLYDGSIWKNIAGGTVRTINNQAPDAQGNISGIVTSVNGVTPNSSGEVTVAATLSEELKAKMLGSRTGIRWKGVFGSNNGYPDRQFSNNICYANGVYVNVIQSYTDAYHSYITSSTDGIHWTKVKQLEIDLSVKCSCYYLAGIGFIIPYYRSSYDYVWISQNGVDWTTIEGELAQGTYPTALYLECEELKIFTFRSNGSTIYKGTKDNGATFTPISLPSGVLFDNTETIPICKGVFGWYAPKNASSSDSTRCILGSSDGFSWVQIATHTSYTSIPSSVACMGGRIYVYGYSSSDSTLRVTDGIELPTIGSSITWLKSNNYGTRNNYFIGISKLNEVILMQSEYLLSHGGILGLVQYAIDKDSTTGLERLWKVIYANGLLIANGGSSDYKNRSILYSVDAVHWSYSNNDAYYSYLTNPSNSDKQIDILGFYGGRWFFTYKNWSSTVNQNAPYLLVSTLDEDLLYM